MKIKAAVLRRFDASLPFADSKPISIEEVTLDPPGPNEVLVKIGGAG
ncbi:MAG: alcohol dehydrogenase, partial [Rhodospirillaceae bacterium]|nr:alcohol dehydrogenase [Rhodospirillaceae bacterium]